MNGKKAKATRKIALRVASVMQAQGIDIAYRKPETNARGSVVNARDSFRGIYRSLKKGMKNGTAPKA
jgi:hypothetical protein